MALISIMHKIFMQFGEKFVARKLPFYSPKFDLSCK